MRPAVRSCLGLPNLEELPAAKMINPVLGLVIPTPIVKTSNFSAIRSFIEVEIAYKSQVA